MPIGSVDQEILNYLAERIFHNLGLSCKISPAKNIPIHAYNKSRLQYNSKLILKDLQYHCSNEMAALIAITEVDLYVPILKYVFGLSQIEGKCSVISLHRLNPQFYTQPFNKLTLLERAEKTALHEIGHSFGLTHCRNRQCVMYSSYNVEDTDFKESRFCSTCFELLRWHVDRISCPNP
ncbi:MAG TPA: archaemetzincin family Zn-dependent metalloprotease [Desulfobacteraceae bacterium]|nr:archaemetzincin family Zn-dependent metalloprotease [Desulfobacteraceae bacterium]HPJ67373.1 archaemetzincin family Zn-dependent metalloprotease [Desulfobacteraceae bacterium]HPQ28122.1 archaemetzincin family Zn-dependent metalloprotease [Desulfobacteraceae bacterium]